jgi:hypothetical protein
MSKLLQHAPLQTTGELPNLPIIDWSKIGHSAPELISINYQGPNAPLPSADIVVITWTSAEWSALDHVFANSQTTRSAKEEQWRKDWHLYSLNAPQSTSPNLWGYYRLVKITNNAGIAQTVLLFKSEAHLAHPNYIAGLSQMVQCIVQDVQPKQVYSIGTAGGSSLSEALGDTVVTNAGHIILKKPENIGVDYNNQTFSCDSWFPTLSLQQSIQDKLLMPLTSVLTPNELDNLLDQLHQAIPSSSIYTLNDLINAPLDPNNLKSPKMLPSKDKALLTTDYYFIANGNDSAQYSTLEMDDTVIGREAGLLNIDYAFVRNISDPIVASVATDGSTIPDDVREEWSSLVYLTCGFYSSFNGALTTWACIVG